MSIIYDNRILIYQKELYGISNKKIYLIKHQQGFENKYRHFAWYDMSYDELK